MDNKTSPNKSPNKSAKSKSRRHPNRKGKKPKQQQQQQVEPKTVTQSGEIDIPLDLALEGSSIVNNEALPQVTVKADADTSSNTDHQSSQETCNDTDEVYPKIIEDQKLQLLALEAQLSAHQEKIKVQAGHLEEKSSRINELQVALVGTNRKCAHFEEQLKQHLSQNIALQNDNDNLNAIIAKLRLQMNDLERIRLKNEEKINILSATLIERETEVSILKLKLTRVQTHLSSSLVSNSHKNQPAGQLKNGDAAMLVRQSSSLECGRKLTNSVLKDDHNIDKNRYSTIWSHLPEDLCPSRRPNFLNDYEELNSYSSENQTSTPRRNNRLYQTLPIQRSTNHRFKNDDANAYNQDKSTPFEDTRLESNQNISSNNKQCQITNLDDSNSTNQSSMKTEDNKDFVAIESLSTSVGEAKSDIISENNSTHAKTEDAGHLSLPMSRNESEHVEEPLIIPPKILSTNAKGVSGLKKFFARFKRSGSLVHEDVSLDKNQVSNEQQIISAGLSPFRRGSSQGRSTLVGVSTNFSPLRQVMKTDKPFSEWNNEMIADWLIMIGLSMYANQCRRWVKWGLQIMNATPAEVDRGLGITNPLHSKKLRLAISELNGDIDKVTKAASKLDYLSVAKWLDDIGLPQYKDKFIEARVDGRVLNYLTVQDLASMNITSLLHHASIRCGIKVLRLIDFDLQKLRRRATSDEIAQLELMRQKIVDEELEKSFSSMNESSIESDNQVSFWTCHRVMEWLRLIDFAEYSSNLRGSGLSGALIVYEDGFNADTMCYILSIPESKTLLRRHLKAFFTALIGKDLSTRKHLYQSNPSNVNLTPSAEIKTHRKSQFSLLRFNSSKVAQENADEYLCPMYPLEPRIATPSSSPVKDISPKLPQIPESIDV